MRGIGSFICWPLNHRSWAACLGLCLLWGALAPFPAVWAQRTRPSAPRRPINLDQEITELQEKARRNAQDYQALNQLADAYIRKARASGDFAFYQKAQSAVDKSLSLRAENYDALKYQATIHLTRHEFPQALKVAQKAAAAQPNESWAYGAMGDALVELGRYDEAVPVMDKMVALRPNLTSYSRVSYLRELYGDIPGAIETMRMAAHSGNPRDAEGIAWCWLHVGYLYFHSGDLDQAEAHFTKSLAALPRYHYALAGLASVRAARKAYPDAVELYNKAIAIVPLPEFVAALGDVYTAMNRPQDAKKQYDLVEHMAKLSQANNEMYDRQLALFYADHDLKPAEALALAQKEIAVRKDIYGYDALAWALYKNKRYTEAAAAMKEALRLGTKDARLFYHAGMIYDGLNEPEKAKDYLRRALAVNPHFHPLQVPEVVSLLKKLEAK